MSEKYSASATSERGAVARDPEFGIRSGTQRFGLSALQFGEGIQHHLRLLVENRSWRPARGSIAHPIYRQAYDLVPSAAPKRRSHSADTLQPSVGQSLE